MVATQGLPNIEWQEAAWREPLYRLSCCRARARHSFQWGHTSRFEAEDKGVLSRLPRWLAVEQGLPFVQALPRGPETSDRLAWDSGPGPHLASTQAGMKPAVVTSGWRCSRGRQAARR